MVTPAVQWNWWLCKTSNLGQLAEITSNAHDKKLQLMLNQPGTATFWMHLEDEKTKYIEEHTTCIVCYRNGKAIWSGPIYNCIEDADNSQNSTIQVTALGWLELFNKRMVHTGFEWKEMAIRSSGREIIRYQESSIRTQEEATKKEQEEIEKQYNEVLAENFYIPVSTESAQQLFYSNTPMASIANDLIIRANIDVQLPITLGLVAPTNSINLTIQQFQSLLEQLNKLTAIESGFDMAIDPLTRKFNTYRNEIKGAITGLGVDRRSGIRFTFPGNCVHVSRSGDGTKTQNRTEAIGEYSIGKEESVSSIIKNGLFEASNSLPEVTNQNILNAYAAVETLTLEQPFKIVTFNPKSVSQQVGVPRPFEDYEIGDIVYATIKKGPKFQIGLQVPQPARIYGMNVSIDSNGTEKITGIQTVYSQ